MECTHKLYTYFVYSMDNDSANTINIHTPQHQYITNDTPTKFTTGINSVLYKFIAYTCRNHWSI